MEVQKMVLGIADYCIFGLMLLVSASIGIYFRFAGGKQKTTEEYLLAGKDMSIWPVAFSLMASFLSAITVIGTPAEMYKFGIHMAYINIGFTIGTIASAYLFVPVFFNLQASTAYEYLERRFGKVVRTLSSLAFVSQMILYMSVVLYAPALALSAVTNLSTWVSVISIGVVCTFYCTLGGMKAVLWTDVFQAILMFLGLFAVLIKGCLDVGGVREVIRIASEGGRLVVPGWELDLTTRYTMLNVVLAGLVLSMASYGGNQVQIQRLLTVKNVKKSQQAIYLHIPMGASFHLLNCFAGVVIYANFYKCDPMLSPARPITSADQMMPYYMMLAMSDYPGLPGLCICGIFSASLSTVSSAVNSLSAVTMEDFVRPFLNARGVTQKKAAFFAKAITLLYGALCIMLTFLVATFGNLIQASLTVFGMLGGPVMGVFFLGMMTTRANEKGVIIGLLTAIACSTWISFGASSYSPPISHLPVSTEDCPAVSSLTSNLSSTILNDTFESTELVSLISHVNVSSSDFSSDPTVVDEPYIFPLYRISYIWVTPLGFFIAAVVGYISSVILKCMLQEEKKIPIELLSPAVRWLVKEEKEEKTKEKKNIEISAPVTIKVTNTMDKSEIKGGTAEKRGL